MRQQRDPKEQESKRSTANASVALQRNGGDWLDKLCGSASAVVCPVPEALPPHTYENSPDEKDVLDHVFERMERSLSLRSAPEPRTEEEESISSSKKAVNNRNREKPPNFRKDDSDSVRDDDNGDEDPLDSVLEKVEGITSCGPRWSKRDVSTIAPTPSIRQTTMTIEDDYITTADLESQGVRVRDSTNMGAPDRSMRLFLNSGGKPLARSRQCTYLLVIAIIVAMVVAGVALIIHSII